MKQFVAHQDKRERLDFLCRVVKKEIQHLQYSAEKVFKDRFSEERASQIANDEEFAEQIEAFTSRFCRLQETIGDKLLPAWLDLAILADALQTAYQHLRFIMGVAESIITDLVNRTIIE